MIPVTAQSSPVCVTISEVKIGSQVPGLYAAGADAGGIFTGGYGSGLAAALVYGRVAAETALL